jgi:hypothetical protein
MGMEILKHTGRGIAAGEVTHFQVIATPGSELLRFYC